MPLLAALLLLPVVRSGFRGARTLPRAKAESRSNSHLARPSAARCNLYSALGPGASDLAATTARAAIPQWRGYSPRPAAAAFRPSPECVRRMCKTIYRQLIILLTRLSRIRTGTAAPAAPPDRRDLGMRAAAGGGRSSFPRRVASRRTTIVNIWPTATPVGSSTVNRRRSCRPFPAG